MRYLIATDARATQHQRTILALAILVVSVLAFGACKATQSPGQDTRLGKGRFGEVNNVTLRGHYYAEKDLAEPATRVGRLGIRLVSRAGDRLVPFDHVFHTGDQIRFEISSNRDGWLYIFNRTPGGEPRRLWPQDVNGEPEWNKVKAYQPSLVPPKGVLAFDEETGNEALYVVIRSERRSPNLQAIWSALGPQYPENQASPAPRDDALSDKRIPSEGSGKIVQFSVRGIGESPSFPTRGLVYIPGDEAPQGQDDPEDLYVYFAPYPVEGNGSDLVREFILRHEP